MTGSPRLPLSAYVARLRALAREVRDDGHLGLAERIDFILGEVEA